MRTLLRQCLRLLGAERGAAAIEFAILAPVMLLILVGAGDFGLSVHSKLQLQAAANAGLQHAIATQGQEIARTQAVITHELGGAPATIEVERFCECSGVKVQCSASCNKPKMSFVSASVSSTSTHLFWPDIALSASFRVYVGEP